MDFQACLTEIVAGLDQPDGRGSGTPGGEAAVAILAEALDRYGLAAPSAGRLQTFDLATREASGEGVILGSSATRVAGDGWEILPGSFPVTLREVRLVSGPFDVPRPLVPTGAPDDAPAVGWVAGAPTETADFLPWIRADPDLALELESTFDLVTTPRLAKGANVLAWLPGAGGLEDEIVLVGAHHDHLAPRGATVFPGADDNSSGVATTLCALASAAGTAPARRRSVIAVFFGGEEDGLWGSQAFVARPAAPLGSLVVAVVADMVGRLDGRPLQVEGETSAGWVKAVGSAALLHDLALVATPGDGISDDASFAVLGIPTVQLFTGRHEDYHERTDTPDRLDWVGLERITRFLADAIAELTVSDDLPDRGTVRDAGIRLGGVSAAGYPLVGEVIRGTRAAKRDAAPGQQVSGCGSWERVEPVQWLVDPGLVGCQFGTAR
ncbi:MAG: M20/M25/M40 family metallo-hydrolase [Deltaproteobacteria bacterium]|nr:M20/M25/M40 family metallo-hydrolase [Deltaproteobacteria bacterium]